MPGYSASEAKFRTAVAAHFDAVKRYCLRRLEVGDVNDAVANVFMVAWRKVDQMPDPGDALPWLYGVARNEVSNRRRSIRRAQALTARVATRPSHTEPGPETQIVAHAEYADLMTALATLRPTDQELLLLRTHEDLDYGAIAIVLGTTPEAVRKRLHRALQRLRRAAGIPEPKVGPTRSRAIEEGGDQ